MNRRAFLAGAISGGIGIAGCIGAADVDPPRIAAGVEWQTIAGEREDRYRKIATSRPQDGPVTTAAPMAADRRIVAYDDGFVTFPEVGPLVVDDATDAALREAYDRVDFVLVLTVYDEDPRNDIPESGSYGYRVDRSPFNAVRAGDRIEFVPDRRDGIPWIDRLEDVDRADEPAGDR